MKLGSNILSFVSIFLIFDFSQNIMQSFSIIVKLSKNLFKSLLFFKLSSFLIATLALCKLSNIAKFSFAKLKDPNSNASLISFSNLLLWFSTSAKDLRIYLLFP